MKTLIIDIETAPVLGHVWRLWKQNVGLNQIVQDWYILSFTAKWLGDPKVIYMDKRKSWDNEDDSEMLLKIHELLNEADVVVTQNGESFDLKKINARFIINGMPPPSPVKSVDTKRIAEKKFGFTSNSLAYMSDKLCTIKKLKHGKFPGHELWRECLLGNQAAWREMRRYNIVDVYATEELYLVFLPWIEKHPNYGLYVNTEHPVCPRCGAEHPRRRGEYLTEVGRYARYHCGNCNGWSRGRILLNTVAERRKLLTGV